MTAPDKIYLNIHPDWTDGEDEPEVTWSEVEDPFYDNVPYIRKDALLEIIETARASAVVQRNFNNRPAEQEARIDAYEYIVNKIKSL